MYLKEIMTIQALLNEGRIKCSSLEKVADKILLLPRNLWKGRKVQVLSGKPSTVRDEEYANWSARFVNFVKGVSRNYAIALFLLPGSICFAGLNLIATPLLVLGLGLKRISLACDPKARAYNAIVTNQLKIDELAQKKMVLEEKLKMAEKNLENAPSAHVTAFTKDLLKGERDQAVKVYMAACMKDLIVLVKAKHKLIGDIEKIEKSAKIAQQQLQESLVSFSCVTR